MTTRRLVNVDDNIADGAIGLQLVVVKSAQPRGRIVQRWELIHIRHQERVLGLGLEARSRCRSEPVL